MRKLLAVLFMGLLLLFAFSYGGESAINNTRPYRWLQSAKRLVGIEKSAGDPRYMTRLSIINATRPRVDVVMLGDSLTEMGEWTDLFPGVAIANRGIGGDTTEGMLERLEPIKAMHPAKAFVMAGINDFMRDRKSPQEVMSSYQRLIAQLRDAGIEVTVQSTLLIEKPSIAEPINAKVRTLNELLGGYCRAGHCQYVDLNGKLAAGGALINQYTYDGIHLTGPAYLIWAREIAGVVH